MGFLGFLKRGKKAGATEAPAAAPHSEAAAAEIALSGVKESLSKQVYSSVAKEKDELSDFYERIARGFAEARKISSDLARKKFEAHDKTYAPVNMIKDNYAKKASSLLGTAPPVSNFGYDETAAFAAASAKTLHELMHVSPKQTILLSRYFKHETSKMISVLKEASEASEGMRSVLDKGMMRFYHDAASMADRLAGMAERVKEIEAREAALHGRIEAKEGEKTANAQELDAFLKGEAFISHVRLGEGIKANEKEWNDIGSKLSEELSGIKRPLKKLEYVAGNEAKDREKAALYSRIAHSPLKVLLQEQGDSLVMEALRKLREMGLKDEERERAEELSKKIETGYIPQLVDRYKWLEGEMAEAKAKFEKAAAPEKKKHVEREIENLDHDIADAHRELERLARSRAETGREMQAGKRQLEEFVLKKINIRLSIML